MDLLYMEGDAMESLVSVIVPVYNVEKYLDRCLMSLIDQTYRPLEIILIDDESRDASGEICDGYASKYEFIHVIHQKNRGIGGARNAGLEQASGEYVFFIDSDDYLEPEAALEKRLTRK